MLRSVTNRWFLYYVTKNASTVNIILRRKRWQDISICSVVQSSNFMDLSPPWEADSCSVSQIIFRKTVPESSLPSSQNSAFGALPRDMWIQSTHLHPVFWGPFQRIPPIQAKVTSVILRWRFCKHLGYAPDEWRTGVPFLATEDTFIFSTVPQLLCDPHNGNRGSFPQEKTAGAWTWPLTSI
jgi:hypothetical protein